MKTQKEVALEAARLLREVGWCQNAFRKRDADGKVMAYCANGALKESAGYSASAYPDNTDAYRLFSSTRDSIDRLMPQLTGLQKRVDGSSDLIIWNDEHTRTREDVISLLERAAELLP